MGYRSNVALALTKEAVQKLNVAITKADDEKSNAASQLLANPDKHLCDADTGAELWSWNAVKWYADYPDVAFVENFMAHIAGNENYHFIRIGEDWDDSEVSGYFLDNPFDLHLIREVAFEE